MDLNCSTAFSIAPSISTTYPLSFLVSSINPYFPYKTNKSNIYTCSRLYIYNIGTEKFWGNLRSNVSKPFMKYPVGKELSLQLYSEKIRNYCIEGCVDKAMLSISEMQALGIYPNLYCYYCLIEALGSVGRTLEAEMMFQEMIYFGLRPNVRIFNVLIRGFLRKGLYELANRTLRVMEELGICKSQDTFEIFLDYYVSSRRLSDTWAIIGDMKKKGYRLNSFVYSRVIELYRDNGMWKKAMEIVREISEMGVAMDRRIYNSIIDTFGKYGELDEAMEVYGKMRGEGIMPDIVTWNCLIKWHCKAGDYTKALDLFTEMQDQGMNPDPKIFNILISQLGDRGKWDLLKENFENMKYRGNKKNGAVYAVLVDIYGQYGKFQGAEDCISALKAEGVEMSANVYSAMANAYAQQVQLLVLCFVTRTLHFTSSICVGPLTLEHGHDSWTLQFWFTILKFFHKIANQTFGQYGHYPNWMGIRV
ncbi:pentatricopeptide repeat-containing protein CRP1, chloroplastic-like isoform X2 [Amaranthus tricolor]|uniref:pentatricopeptide repeat-containing protein CRP1, chloroplastic-like isoform X2 n=1 Tax=Amaranthus tricolor TaxID=29722 RepID=UPI002589BFED|nr:pentatricopeptide repeat-containing protein CRP1, chloroplastic-like isoform X2 [Amaranthus tricolor]